ncbi:MAG: hypothetical protein ACI867_000405 [Glaciecola sp.]|jgi:hypothetical protein
MYRDDPLDDEAELREVLGDDAVDALKSSETAFEESGFAEAAFDALTLLRGWVGQDDAAAWFRAPLARLEGRTPTEAFIDGDLDDALDAARRFAAAQG